MTHDLGDLTAALLAAAKTAGAEAADAIATDGTSVQIGVKAGKLEQAERAEGIEIGLRVLIGQKQAIVSASDTSADTITEMAQRAVAMARVAPDDPWIGLADPAQLASARDASGLELFDPSGEPDVAALQEDAQAAEAAALDVAGISQVESASAGYSANRVHLAASNGFAGGYARTGRGISCVAITGEGTGMERDYFGDHRIFGADLSAAATVGQIAAERTLARAGARKPPTGAYPVLYDERIAAGLIGHLLSAVNGSAVARGASWLRDDLGKQVLPNDLTITENPLRPRTSGSRPFDAEGLPVATREIVAGGILQSFTLDLASARQLGMESTGAARRGTSSAPRPGLSNIALTQSTASRDDLIRDMGTGLIVTSMLGSSINPNTGDYSRGASGLWVENGQVQFAVNECTIAGNLRDMLRSLRAANDARPHLSHVVPSLLVEGLTIAGA